MRIDFQVQAQEDGAPLSGALVGCAGYGGDHPRGTLRTMRTDAAGAATFDFVGTVEHACLFAAAAGRTPVQLEMRAPDQLPATLQLPAGLTFAGTVRTADGRPVAGAEIDLVIEGPNWIGNGSNLGTGDGHWPPQCRTDERGRFALEWFDPRWCRHDEAHVGLEVSHLDYLAQVVSIDRHLESTGSCELDLVLATGLEFAGTVRDASGRPLADAQVEAWYRPRPAPMSASHRRRCRTDGDGAFRLRGLQAAVHEVEVVARNAAPFRTKVDPRTSSRADFRLRRGASLEGVLLDAAGQPCAGQLVQASKLLPRLNRQATTDGAGSFRIDGLPRRGRVTVRAGSDVNQTIRLPALPVVLRPELLPFEVSVVDRAGAPVPSAGVSFHCPWGGTWRQCDERGTARMQGPPGWYWIDTWVPGHAGRIRFFRLRSGAIRAPIILRLPNGRTLHGRVMDQGRNPVAACKIVATHCFRHLERHETTTDATGAFTLSHLRGRYRILCQAEGHEPAAIDKRIGRLLPFAARLTVQLAR